MGTCTTHTHTHTHTRPGTLLCAKLLACYRVLNAWTDPKGEGTQTMTWPVHWTVQTNRGAPDLWPTFTAQGQCHAQCMHLVELSISGINVSVATWPTHCHCHLGTKKKLHENLTATLGCHHNTLRFQSHSKMMYTHTTWLPGVLSRKGIS